MSGAPRHGGEKSFKEYAMAQDYTVDIKVKGLGEAAKKLSDFTDELNKAREEGQSVGGAIDYATGGALSGFKKAATGIKTFVKGLKMTRAALIATGIGAFVVIVGSLISAFASTEKGARMIKVAMAGVGAIFEQVTAQFQAAGGFLVNLFTKGHTAAAEEYRRTVADLPQTFSEAITKAIELEKRTQALTDAQIKLTVQRSRDRAEIKRLNMIAEDTTKSLKEREDAAKEAIAIEQALMAERQRIAQEELLIATQKSEASDISTEERQHLADLEAALIDIQTESVEMQTTLNNKLNTIRQQAAAAAEAEAKAIEDAAEAKRIAEQEAADAIIKSEQEVVEALANRDRASLDARTKEILALEDFYNAQLDKAAENAELQKEIEEQRETELSAMRERFRMEDAAKAEEARQKEAEANQQVRDEELDRERASLQAEMSLKEEMTSNAFSIISNLNQAFSKQGEQQSKKSFERTKAISIAETLVSTYLSAQKAFESQFKPLSTVDSPIRGALAAGAAVASGLARVAAIKSQQFTGGGGTGGGGGGNVSGGGGVSVGVDVGSLVPNTATPTPEPVRAYVVSNEISNQQALDRELQIQTTL